MYCSAQNRSYPTDLRNRRNLARGGYSSSPVLDLQGQARRRLISTQVDGGRSIVREAGLVDKNAGEAKDAYLFFMERAPDYVAD